MAVMADLDALHEVRGRGTKWSAHSVTLQDVNVPSCMMSIHDIYQSGDVGSPSWSCTRAADLMNDLPLRMVVRCVLS